MSDPERTRARPGHSDRPSKHVWFTGPDRREVANALEALALLEGVSVSDLMQRLLREAVHRDARVRPFLAPTRDEGVTIDQSQPGA